MNDTEKTPKSDTDQTPNGAPHPSFRAVVDELASDAPILSALRLRPGIRRELPSRDRLVQILETLRSILFPGYFGEAEVSVDTLTYAIGASVERVYHGLSEQIRRGLCAACDSPVSRAADCAQCQSRAREITLSFLQRLPAVREMLLSDVCAAYEGDPAAKSPAEVLFSYPGILAITNYRIAHELLSLGVPYLPRMITEHAHSITGIDIHPGAQIGGSFFIDHGTGVVIGETSIIGRGVRLYQGVTLGAQSFPLDSDGNPIKGNARHPIVEDGVVIYSNATILGRITIGRNSTIGGNVWVTHSVPPNTLVTQSGLKTPQRSEIFTPLPERPEKI